MAQKLALLGDSMIATGYDQANNRTLNRWISGPLVSLLGPTFAGYYNFGVGGDTIEDCLARIGDVTSSDADWVLVECGINNLSRPETTLDSMIDAYENVIRELIVAGKKIICCTVLERKLIKDGGAVEKKQYDIRPLFNNWLRDTLASSGNIKALIDFDQPGSSGVEWNPKKDALDNTHPNTSKCTDIAALIADKVKAALVNDGLSEITLGSNRLATPQLMGNAGTSTGAHISGDIATGWRFLDAQTGTEQIKCETILDTPGGTQKLTFSGKPSGVAVSDFFRDNQSLVSFTSGEIAMTSFRLRTQDLSGVIGIYSQLIIPYVGGTQYVSAMYVSPSDSNTHYRQIKPTDDITIWSPPYTITENVTGCTFRLALCYLDGAPLSGSASISEPFVGVVQ